MMPVLSALLVGGGLALLVVGGLSRGRERDADLAAILGLPFGERDVPVESVTERPIPLVAPAAQLAARLDRTGGLAAALAAAAMQVRAGEYLVLAATGSIVAAAVMTVVLSSWILGVAGAAGVAYAAAVVPRLKAATRRRAIEGQLPDALATIGASLEAGHTFLRAIQMYAEEAQPPLSDELTRVVTDSSLGAPVLDALDRMAGRLRIADLDWVVQAIRIQHATGGRLAEVLHTLADFMRAREDVRREVKTLTAEGRVSAAVLGAMPPLMFLTFQAINPGYAEPLLRGWGLAVLAGAAMSTAVGIGLIVRMVKIEV